MAIDLRKDILGDKAKYPDNLVWNLGDGTPVTLGQLRSLSVEDQNAISKAEKELENRRKEMDSKDVELKKAQTNTANLFVNLQTALQAIKDGKFDTLSPEVKALFGNQAPNGSGNGNNNNDPFAALARIEQDTLLGPLVAVVKAVNAEAQKAQKAVADNIEVQKKMATNYMNGVLEDRYERIVPADKQDKFTLEALLKEAVRINAWSSDTVPNIRAAYNSLTAGDTAAAREAAIRKEERDKVIAEMNGRAPDGNSQIFVPTPQNFGLDVHNRSGAAPKPFKNLDDAFAAAAADKDIWANVDKTVQ